MENKNTLLDYLTDYAEENPQKRLFGSRGQWLTAREVLTHVEGAAGCLAELGIRQGSWVALRMNQTAEAAVWLLALQALGAVAVLTDPRSEANEFLSRCTGDIHPQWEILLDDGWHLRRLPNGQRQILDMDGSRTAFPVLSGRENAMVIFTSGSTGKSKGVRLCQQNLISNLLDSAPLGGYDEDDVALGALPLHHVFGLALLTGAIVLRHSLYFTPGGDLDTVLATIQEQGITRMNGVPSLYGNMVRQKGSYDLHTLRVGYIGGGPCTAEQFAEIEDKLGMTLVSVYGMSECIGISCSSYRDSQAVRAGGVGKFYPLNCGKILLEDGSEALPGQIGEVCVSGPMRMLGYCDEAETEAAIDALGFLHTGDLGYVEDTGVLHLTGRKRDIIIRNGINLSPRKIEEALLSIPGVSQAAVVGIDHSLQGEVPCAMVVGCHSELTLTAMLSGLLPKNEIPVGISMVEQLPQTASGKPDKVTIREVLTQWMTVRS